MPDLRAKEAQGSATSHEGRCLCSTGYPFAMDTKAAIPALKACLATPGKRLRLKGLKGTACTWLISRALRGTDRTVLWITRDQDQAEEVLADLAAFTDLPLLGFPCHDAPPFVPILPSHEILGARIATLYRLGVEDRAMIVVAPAQALLEYTLPRDLLLGHVELVMAGEDLDVEALGRWLARTGYESSPVVQSRGQFSMRGGILDVFPPGRDLPVRIDLFGDTVEEIRTFDPRTQRSTGTVDELVLLPCQELVYLDPWFGNGQSRIVERAASFGWTPAALNALLQQVEQCRVMESQRVLAPVFYPERPSLFDYLPRDVLVVLHDPLELENAVRDSWEKAAGLYETSCRGGGRVLGVLEEYILPREDLASRLGDHSIWSVELVPAVMEPAGEGLFVPGADREAVEEMEVETRLPEIVPARGRIGAKGLFRAVTEGIRGWVDEGFKVVVSVPGRRHAQRLWELFKMHGLVPVEAGMVFEDPPLGEGKGRGQGVAFLRSRISRGFVSPGDRLVVLAEGEILGTRARAARPSDRTGPTPVFSFEELERDRPVVHRDHGIGIYRGLVRMETLGTRGEFLLIEYRDGDKLYLPVDRLGLLQPYVGVEGREPRLDKLGGGTWQLKKQRVKRAIYEIAHELVELYAARKVRQGHPFSPPDAMFRQFEAEFPYEETRDQEAAIRECLKDLEEPRPMDRLLCGDVGFGKTEVAMRVAFKVVEDGKQVAVLVPTTILAEQHERTFRQRFRRFPVKVAALSRLKGRSEQQEVLRRAASGEVDILIGTHRLLQSDVRFKDLGLLIVDEEHRFGVRHKERLKRLKQTVDCLSLTATPIPRTLQLSLLGVRDLSTINTPPRERLPVKTYLAQWDDSLIKQAIEREKARGGQVFLVHNRVKGIYRVAEHVRALVPGARVQVAHGQMAPSELEEVMVQFVRGEVDCLVCTTIVESGLDIPAANTIIINRADRMGLADLYQLRGRVGRAREQAFAYLVVPEPSALSEQARKRLRAVLELGDTLGGGFRLAMHDLQIRGAGNILGISQSGQIAEVGYEMYLGLLQDAVEELKGRPPGEEVDPEVNLGISAFIPERYVPDAEIRLGLYRRIARSADELAAAELAREMADRFGPMPEEVRNLFAIIELKRRLRALNVIRLDAARNSVPPRVVMAFDAKGPPDVEAVLKLVQRRNGWRLLPDQRLVVEVGPPSPEGVFIQAVQKALQVMLDMVNGR